MMPRILIFMTAALLFSGGSLLADNLIKNGDFAAIAPEGLPEVWKVSDFVQTTTVDVRDKPAGVARSLRVDIEREFETHGQIVQSFSDLKQETTYLLEGWIKSSVPGIGYLQIKLYSKTPKAELMKINVPKEKSTGEWRKVSQEFSTLKADNVNVFLRFHQDKDAVDQKVWFADIRLSEKTAAP